jgi:hypothetical protein
VVGGVDDDDDLALIEVEAAAAEAPEDLQEQLLALAAEVEARGAQEGGEAVDPGLDRAAGETREVLEPD